LKKNSDQFSFVLTLCCFHSNVSAARCYAIAWYLLSLCVVRPSVHLSVTNRCFFRNDWTNQAGCWHGGYLPPIPHCECVVRKFGYLERLRYFPLELFPKLPAQMISPRQVDRVVNKTRRRRRRSSLLTTPIRQSTSRGCLLQVGQL